VSCCTVLYFIVLQCTALCCSMLHCIVMYKKHAIAKLSVHVINLELSIVIGSLWKVMEIP